MNTETFIANTALSLAGVKATIQSLDEQSAEAKRCRPFMPLVRKSTLEAFDWSFARRRKALALHGEDAPEDMWLLRYRWPANCIAFRRIQNPLGENADPVPFAVELNDAGTEKTILTDMEEAIGVYTFDIQDLSLTTAHFQTTMACLLGSFIAMPTSSKVDVKRELLGQYYQMIRIAPAFNANESASTPKDAPWITGR